MSTGPRALKRTRALIDVVDDGLLLLLAARRQLALGAARYKHTARLPPSDTAREQQVQHRAALLARRLGVPAATARALMTLVIADARHCQGLASDVDQGAAVSGRGMIAVDLATTDTTPIEAAGTDMPTTDTHHTGSRDARQSSHWLRLLPPPSRWAIILRACPPALQRRLLEQAMELAQFLRVIGKRRQCLVAEPLVRLPSAPHAARDPVGDLLLFGDLVVPRAQHGVQALKYQQYPADGTTAYASDGSTAAYHANAGARHTFKQDSCKFFI